MLTETKSLPRTILKAHYHIVLVNSRDSNFLQNTDPKIQDRIIKKRRLLVSFELMTSWFFNMQANQLYQASPNKSYHTQHVNLDYFYHVSLDYFYLWALIPSPCDDLET